MEQKRDTRGTHCHFRPPTAGRPAGTRSCTTRESGMASTDPARTHRHWPPAPRELHPKGAAARLTNMRDNNCYNASVGCTLRTAVSFPTLQVRRLEREKANTVYLVQDNREPRDGKHSPILERKSPALASLRPAPAALPRRRSRGALHLRTSPSEARPTRFRASERSCARSIPALVLVSEESFG